MRSTYPIVALVCGLILGACDADDPDACPPAGRDLCDPIEQRCCDGGEHCVLTFQGGAFAEACLGGTPEAGDGDPCAPYSTAGADACVGGLVCLQVTGVDTEPVCHGICTSSDDCANGSCTQELAGVPGLRACVDG